MCATHPLRYGGGIIVADAVGRKTAIEEAVLSQRFPDVSDFATRTARFNPGIFQGAPLETHHHFEGKLGGLHLMGFRVGKI